MPAVFIKWLFLVMWAVAIVVGLVLYSQRQLSEFDPHLALSQAAASTQFDQQLIDELNLLGVEAGAIVHLTSNNDCYCQHLSEPHVRELQSKLQRDKLAWHSINVSEHPKLANWFQSTPAVVILDQAARLRYVGPYAVGYGCFTGANLVDTISRELHREAYQGPLLTLDAQGCFCAT